MSFFTVASFVMLVGVLVGFSPTFFLRPLYTDSRLPWHLILHGVLMTGWFVLVFVQAYLVDVRRMSWHRPLGWAGVALSVLVVASSVPVLTHSVPNGLSTGLPAFAVSFVFMTGVLRVVFFSAMVITAIIWRRQRAVHARALFLASLSNVAPATSRIANAFDWNPVLIAFVYLIPFAVLLVWHDRLTLGRAHAVTRYGLAGVVLILLLPIVLIFGGASSVVVAYVR